MTGCGVCSSASAQDPSYIRYQEPDFLTFTEIQKLAETSHQEKPLQSKIHTFFRTPIISNEAYYRGVQPHYPFDPVLGHCLRLVSWNIEKSIRMKVAITAFTSEEDYVKLLDLKKAPFLSRKRDSALRQREKLETADIIVLQEMEIGIKRSGYIHAARALAESLDMNYAYGAQYLEVDPVQLGLEKIFYEDGNTDTEATDYYTVAPNRYKGVFGSAVLSRYPIKKVEVFPLKTQPYDWYTSEKKKTTYLEKTRRFGSKTVFQNEITREIKVGGRHFFRVDLDVPHLPEGTLTIINIHLEIKCLPKERTEQIQEILSYIRHIQNPVILVGDFNAAWRDLSPTSIRRAAWRTLKDPTTWLSVIVGNTSPYGFTINFLRLTSNLTKNLFNPVAPHVPIIMPNHTKKMFTTIENFRFSDRRAFDFRGDKERSINNKQKMLANSNQRGRKGFKTSFSVTRPIAKFIGLYRLDWAFVKPYINDPNDTDAPYRFAPHFGEIFQDLNNSLDEKISDHHPLCVDLPFNEPSIKNIKRSKKQLALKTIAFPFKAVLWPFKKIIDVMH